jgi:hypothetical protein
MKKFQIILTGVLFLLVFSINQSKASVVECPDGYDIHDKYTYGGLILCDHEGDECCTPSN